ncbi:MAG: succinylglutamate desuccinylase/aspartoacylase family protein [Proteobacteria bacterium]|jgi:predicted deacylase|nr:succinylglutamate desuccinylase/aspartoacylase family protein [Pseudomonadota bacterium]
MSGTSKTSTVLKPIYFGNLSVHPGEAKRLELPVSKLLTQSSISIPLHVIYGKKPGPTVCFNATLHGDEICGMEIIREVIPKISPKELSGTLIFVPVVNIFGFIYNSRYLPDRRDLNRCFPGSERGSMASRLAHLYIKEVISKCDYAVDFHTAALGRTNYPQIRANLNDKQIYEFAKSFQAPIIVHSKEISGSLRETAVKKNCKMIVYEGGEVNRFDDFSIKVGVQGVFNCLAKLKMIPGSYSIKKPKSLEYKTTKWVRASKSGLFQFSKKLGSSVKQRETIGSIFNIFGDQIATVNAPTSGIIIGMATNPKVYQGDAIIHLACN